MNMKKTYGFLLTAATLVMMVPFAMADGEDSIQKGPDYEDNGSGICYKKSISEPDEDGIYWITLESFAKGSSVKKQESIAADIVLVLDTSGSMAYDMNGNSPRSRSFDSNNVRMDALKKAVNAFIEMIDTNDKENAPEGRSRLGNRIAIVTFAQNGINASDGFKTLEQADKNSLLQTVRNLSADGGTMANRGMQVAYDLLSNKNVSTNNLKTVVLFTDGEPGAYGYWDEVGHTNSYNYSMDSDPEYIIVPGETRYQNTWNCANETIRIANEIKKLKVDSNDVTKKVISNVFTVSIILDPSDYTNVYLGKTSSDYLGATNMGTLTISREWSYYDGWEYIHSGWDANNPFANGSDGTRNTSSTDYSLEATSTAALIKAFETVAGESGGSSYPMTEESVAKVDVVSASFMLPPGTDETKIKLYVAKCNGRQTKTYLDEDTSEQKSKIFYQFADTVAKAKCTDTYMKPVLDDDDKPTGETVETSVAGGLKVTLKASGTYPADKNKKDMIEVTGFDYGNLWVGPVYKEGVPEDIEMEDATDDQIAGYHGYKLVVRIPIQMDTYAVGGPNVDTNGPGSGIIVNGSPVVEFKSPVVSLPINLHIRKQGLNVGESAKFTIQRALLPSDWVKPGNSTDPAYDRLTWEDVSSVFVTRHDGQEIEGIKAPVTKVVGMPSTNEAGAEFVYRIVENKDWSWSYKPGETLVFTSDQLITNPFIFYNTKQNEMIDVKIRHAESKATNTFKSGDFVVDGKVVKKVNSTHVGYDDSKSNKRDVIKIESE